MWAYFITLTRKLRAESLHITDTSSGSRLEHVTLDVLFDDGNLLSEGRLLLGGQLTEHAAEFLRLQAAKHKNKSIEDTPTTKASKKLK